MSLTRAETALMWLPTRPGERWALVMGGLREAPLCQSRSWSLSSAVNTLYPCATQFHRSAPPGPLSIRLTCRPRSTRVGAVGSGPMPPCRVGDELARSMRRRHDPSFGLATLSPRCPAPARPPCLAAAKPISRLTRQIRCRSEVQQGSVARRPLLSEPGALGRPEMRGN